MRVAPATSEKAALLSTERNAAAPCPRLHNAFLHLQAHDVMCSSLIVSPNAIFGLPSNHHHALNTMPPKKSVPSGEPRRSTRTKTPTSKSTSSTSKTKSSTSTKSTTTPSKSSSTKTHGSKHDSTDAPAAHNATAFHLPKKGQKVTWKAMPGWVEGHVLEILTSNNEVEGKSVKASKEDPRIVLKSHGPSGKVAVHKAGAVWFD